MFIFINGKQLKQLIVVYDDQPWAAPGVALLPSRRRYLPRGPPMYPPRLPAATSGSISTIDLLLGAVVVVAVRGGGGEGGETSCRGG